MSDWGSVTDWISAITNVVLVGLAVYGFKAWQSEFRMQKRFEIASRAVETFSKAEEALAYCRSRFVAGGEGQATLDRYLAEFTEIEDPLADDQRTSMLVPAAVLERLDSPSVRADFAALDEVRHQTAIILGAEAKAAVEVLLKQRTAAFNAAHHYLKSMIEDYRPYVMGADTTMDQMRRTMIELGEDDAITSRIKKARDELERITEPTLKIARH